MMANLRRIAALALTIGLAGASSACGRDAEVVDDRAAPPASEAAPATATLSVADVDLARSVGPDMRVADADETDDFGPTDTIYASVETRGTGSNATLTARWTFEDGQVVDETSRTISPSGPAFTEFHISKPDGFPVGDYAVEILLNGTSVERSDFEVR